MGEGRSEYKLRSGIKLFQEAASPLSGGFFPLLLINKRVARAGRAVGGDGRAESEGG